MVTVRFFASLREQLGTGELQLAWSDGLRSVSDLVALLGRVKGQAWGEALAARHLIVARNHAVVERDTALADGDEIAFYPPVTGG